MSRRVSVGQGIHENREKAAQVHFGVTGQHTPPSTISLLISGASPVSAFAPPPLP